MDKAQTLQILSSRLSEIQRRFAVEHISLFGSVARDEAGSGSDVDILISYRETPGLFQFLELKDYLEKEMNCSVDLVTEKALKKQLRERIMREAIRVS
ncbi:MAG: nucleotidyltransferase family protein [Deltaproteobacteria bacterium]|nr:nucleotidyltransferase family protein [Deltaproteobacteria bacterium]